MRRYPYPDYPSGSGRRSRRVRDLFLQLLDFAQMHETLNRILFVPSYAPPSGHPVAAITYRAKGLRARC
jgi:hypothetical protein